MVDNVKKISLVFDWGNTVMKEFQEYHGAMVDWPKVEAMPGIKQALGELQREYTLFLGTNAKNSDGPQIRQALKRAGLDGYFESIFTFNETQANKPELGFYRSIEQLTGGRPSQMLMIGDLYDKDITGAKAAGWKAAWYNRQGEPCQAALPMHDLEIFDLKSLPAALKEHPLPEVQTCLLWLQQNGASTHLLVHVQLVAAIAYQVAVWIRAMDISVNPILAHRGGLLHDMAKMHQSEGMDHGQAAESLLEGMGEPALARIADHHMLFALLDEKRAASTCEEKLVYYADKLVEKNELVSVDKRLAGLQKRYRIDSGVMMEQLTPRIKALEAEICSLIGATPEDLLERLKKGMRN